MFADDKKKFKFDGVYNKEIAQKRKNARIPVEIKGTFIYMDVDNKITDKCIITNLSTGGVAFETNAVLLRGDIITISFPLSGTIIKEEAQITRNTGREVGCRFLHPDPRNVEIIQQYIYKKLFS